MQYMRKLIRIDEEKCTGCGLCVPGCEEGALRIIDGKARLVSEVYCDGLGACLGHCPEGALSVIDVPARDFDPDAVREHLAAQGREALEHMPAPEELRLGPATALPGGAPAPRPLASCRGANTPVLQAGGCSNLEHWPVQLRLVQPDALFLKNAELLLTADCVPVAMPGYHGLIAGKVVLLGCPKFDDAESYVAKLAEIFARNEPASVTVLEMEVPCCANFTRIVLAACGRAGVAPGLERRVIARTGEVLRAETLEPRPLPSSQPSMEAGRDQAL